MKILEIAGEQLPDKTVITVGNFDGVHSGHKALLEQVVARGKERNLKTAVLTFDPHTRTVLFPELSQHILTTFEEKARLLDQLGIDYLVRIPFTKEFSQKSQDEFVKEVLVDRLNTSDWVMGEGHSVGKNRGSSTFFLRDTIKKYYITMFIADLLTSNEHVVSSTVIRKLLTDGRLTEAVGMLGHPYLILAERIRGLKIGSQIGYPTFNFTRPPSQKVIPPPGVYVAELEFDGNVQPGALYFGECPTFAQRDVHFEFHSLGFNGREPEVGQIAHLWVYKYVRPDETFSDSAALVDRIKKDIEAIRNFFQEEKRGHGRDQGT